MNVSGPQEIVIVPFDLNPVFAFTGSPAAVSAKALESVQNLTHSGHFHTLVTTTLDEIF
jgi:hypothetical protein